MPRRMTGRDHITVLRSPGERNRYGTAPAPTRHPEGPCMVDRTPKPSGINEVSSVPMEATNREIWLYFRHEPDVKATDDVELDDGQRYRVIAVDRIYRQGRRDGLAGVIVRIAGLEEGA